MALLEKSLYHQIHPLKLIADWGTGILALSSFWQHQLWMTLALAIVPSILVSFILVRYADLEKYRQSSFGSYIHRYMTRATEILRFGGYILMAVGAWYHLAWLIVIGLATIVFCLDTRHPIPGQILIYEQARRLTAGSSS